MVTTPNAKTIWFQKTYLSIESAHPGYFYRKPEIMPWNVKNILLPSIAKTGKKMVSYFNCTTDSNFFCKNSNNKEDIQKRSTSAQPPSHLTAFSFLK
jgi:hypothetical protein